MQYNKPPLNYDEQIDLLIERGLKVSDRLFARDVLARISYYRLSAYRFPFQDQKDKFKDGTTFEDLYSLYNFDHELRQIIFDSLGIVEVAFRSKLIYHLAHIYGAFGYINKSSFTSGFDHEKWLAGVSEEISRSRETFVNHYRIKYQKSEHFPLWMLGEVLSFGSLSRLYTGLNNVDKTAIAKEFGVHFPVMQSWVHSLVYVRNVCAHHSRLWNKELAIRPIIPHKTKEWQQPISVGNARIFSIILVIHYCLRQVKSDYDLKGRIKRLIQGYPVDIAAMGMARNWEEHSILKA